MSQIDIEPGVAETARQLTALSDAEQISFPDVLRRMSAMGIERYHADLMRDEKVHYLPDGRSKAIAAKPLAGQVAAAFSADGVERATQAGRIKYAEFCRQIAAAGCAGYLVMLSGRRAVYYGRTGETRVEHFPTGP